jgi:hypothetical protein
MKNSTVRQDDGEKISAGNAQASEDANLSQVADAFHAASALLRSALTRSSQGDADQDIARLRLKVRQLAINLRDSGYWRNDKAGLRAAVSLLWEADRFISDRTLLGEAGKNSG